MAHALRRPMRRAAARDAAAADDGTATRPARTRVAAARGAWAVGSFLLAIARLVRLATFIAVAIIVAGIVLRLVGANGANTIVHDVHQAGAWLVQPFKDVFSVKKPKESIALNWGLAALIYLIVGTMIASFIARIAPTGVHPRESVA